MIGFPNMEQWQVQEQSLKMKMEEMAHTDFAKIKKDSSTLEEVFEDEVLGFSSCHDSTRPLHRNNVSSFLFLMHLVE
jgi:hypothetical protein